MSPAQLFAPFLGAVIYEVLHWYLLREKLTQRKYRALLRSPLYWTATFAMVIIGAVGTLYVFGSLGVPQLTVAGAAFPAVFEKLVKAVPTPGLTYGPEDDAESFTLADFLAA